MSGNDKVDIIIFGATGYTGKYVIEEFILISENKYSWAIAGRNLKKLQEVLEWASKKTGQDVTKIPIIICDCEDETSLNKMAQSGSVIINCCGPYQLYGIPVIKACLENGTHHIDITAEPEYMETIQLDYHVAAERKGIYIVSACGFGSVPCDWGVTHFINNFPGQVNSVESFFNYSPEIHKSGEPVASSGTWKSAVYGFANYQKLLSIRNKLYPKSNRPKLEPRLKARFLIHRCDLFNNKFTVPIPEPDPSVVFRSQMFMRNYYKQRPVQYNAYFVCPSFTALIMVAMVGLFLLIFSKFGCGRRLLLRYPGFFSFGLMTTNGPSEEALLNSSACFKFRGEGWTKDIADQFENKEDINVPPNKKMLTEMSFKNPGYGFTSKAMIYSAFTILKESDKMPSKGGVYTPAGAFSKTTFFDQLLKNEVSLNIRNETSLNIVDVL